MTIFSHVYMVADEDLASLWFRFSRCICLVFRFFVSSFIPWSVLASFRRVSRAISHVQWKDFFVDSKTLFQSSVRLRLMDVETEMTWIEAKKHLLCIELSRRALPHRRSQYQEATTHIRKTKMFRQGTHTTVITSTARKMYRKHRKQPEVKKTALAPFLFPAHHP